MYTRWFIDQAKMNEDRPNIFSFPTALFNVLDSQYNTLSGTTINKAQFEKVLINIYELWLTAKIYLDNPTIYYAIDNIL